MAYRVTLREPRLIVKQVGLLQRDGVMEQILEHCHRRTYPAKTVIINAGDHSDEFYYLVAGSVSVLIEDDDGHEIVLAYLNAGDFFGEIGMFDEKHERSACGPVPKVKWRRSVTTVYVI